MENFLVAFHLGGENQHNSLGDDDMHGLVHDAFGVPNEDGSTKEYTGSPMDA